MGAGQVIPPLPAGFTPIEDDSPPLPPGFQMVPDARQVPVQQPSGGGGSPTGQAHDGDTFRLDTGANARMLGYDAFELNQTARGPSGAVVPIGQQSRSALLPYLSGGTFAPSGTQSYGRPVGLLSNGGADIGRSLLRQGYGLAAPEYLANDPLRRADYLEAERLARLNRLGVHGDSYVTPQAFRRGTTEAPPAERPKDGPWAQAEWSDKGGAAAVFADDPTPFQGLRQDIADGYIALTNDPNSTVDQIVDYGTANGFKVDRKEAEKFVRMRNAGHTPTGKITYKRAPRVLTDPGDGAFGATMRGVGDPLNVLDEAGALVDSLGGTGGRESILNSDRRWADIYANNLDQNRSILANDDAAHPYARFGGQLASGLAIPGASVEGVGLGAARGALRAGGSRMAAVSAAESAVRRRLATAGAAEAGVAGAGAAEGGLFDRAKGAALYAPVGAALGYGAAGIAQRLAGLARNRVGRTVGAAVGSDVAPALSRGGPDAMTVAPPIAPNPAASPVAATTIDSAALRAAADTGAGVDMGRAGDILRQSADDALARGDDVVMHIEGKPIRITAPGLVDDTGQRWGAMPILSPARGDNARLEIVPNGGRSSPARDTPPLPAGFTLMDDVADMANETPRPTLDGPRVPDRIDRRPVRQPLADMPDGERLAAAAQLNSRDMLPLPSNTVRNMDEAAGIEAGRYQTVRAPNEATTLERRNLSSPSDGTRMIPKRGPVDLVTWARTQGGLRDDGGDLAQLGLTNAPRNGMDFASGEQRFGRLVDDVTGLDLDQAALRAWEDGYFPDHVEPPTRNEFLDALAGTHRGGNRVFHPDDFAEVDAFEAARAQRLEVEAAQAEGAPLTLDRGQPVGPDDLDANAPPVRAYEEWGENAPDLAGNIRLDKLDSPQAIGRALAETDRMVGGFDAAKRGRIAQAETKALAEDLGMTADDLLRRRKGQAFNAEEALAARQLLARSASDLVNMAKRIARTKNAGDEVEAAFREAWLRHAAIQEQVAGMTAEAGRLLQQFRMTADSRDATQALASIGDVLGGSARIRDVAEKIVDLEAAGTTPAGVNRFALKAVSPQWKDKATELYINSLLSGPQTHAVNILSNTLTSIAQVPEHGAAAVVGLLRKMLPGQAATDRVLFSELGARSVGMIAGAKEGIRAAARSFLTGESADAITKVETQQMKAIGGRAGEFIRIPTRLLTAEDELFKGIARRMELGGLAVRQAAAEGLTGKEARDRAADLVLNPPDDMLRKSFDYARYLTFQTPLDHDSLAGGLSRATQRRQELKLLFPFVRTPVNLLKFAAERSPAAPLMKSWRKELAAGGARRDMAIARMVLGTGLGAAMYEMALSGHITGGGPADPQTRRLMQANGWQPYSLRVGDRYYSYQRLDPFSTTIGTVADMVDLSSNLTDEDRDHILARTGIAIVHNLSSKTWLSGISSALEAINDPDRYLSGFTARTAGSLAVPSIVAQVARVSDPVMREAREPLDRIRSRIPGLSDDLLPRRDVFGRPVMSQGGVGPDIVSPIFTGTAKNDPTISALTSSGIGISAPQRTYVEGGKRVQWTPQQYDRLQVLVGQAAKPRLDALAGSPGWRAMSLDQREDAVGKIMREARKDGRAKLRGLFGAPMLADKAPPLPPGFVAEPAPPLPAGFELID